jgi:hypothetical protein
MPLHNAAELSMQELSKFFSMPEKAVAKELGICLTSLKKICRQNGINRWPYRKVRLCRDASCACHTVLAAPLAQAPTRSIRQCSCKLDASTFSPCFATGWREGMLLGARDADRRNCCMCRLRAWTRSCESSMRQ